MKIDDVGLFMNFHLHSIRLSLSISIHCLCKVKRVVKNLPLNNK